MNVIGDISIIIFEFGAFILIVFVFIVFLVLPGTCRVHITKKRRTQFNEHTACTGSLRCDHVFDIFTCGVIVFAELFLVFVLFVVIIIVIVIIVVVVVIVLIVIVIVRRILVDVVVGFIGRRVALGVARELPIVRLTQRGFDVYVDRAGLVIVEFIARVRLVAVSFVTLLVEVVIVVALFARRRWTCQANIAFLFAGDVLVVVAVPIAERTTPVMISREGQGELPMLGFAIVSIGAFHVDVLVGTVGFFGIVVMFAGGRRTRT